MSSSKKRSGLHLHDPNDMDMVIEREEIAKLTKLAKSWDYTCSFCFKKFPSAQAMGGHQNSHKNERLEEKRLFVKDPLGYRKRAYLRALKKAQLPAKDNLHAAANHNDTTSGTSSPTGVLMMVSSPSDLQLTNHGGLPSGSKDVIAINGGHATQVMKNNNLPPPLKELNLIEKIGDCDKDGSGSCFDQFNRGVEEVDLALKL